MKRTLIIILLLLTMFSGCYENKKVIHAYVGAGMQKPMDEIGKEFEREYNVRVEYDYAGSGYLYSKILATKKGDIFMPGSYYYIKKLEEKGLILKCANISYHIPVIVVKKGNPKHIKNILDLAKPGVKIAVGDKNIAIGRVTEKILDKLNKDHPGIKEKIERNIVVKGATVKQVLFYVLNGDVDAAIVWRADAVENKDRVEIINIDKKYNVIKTIPIAILKTTKDEKLANQFYNFVLTKGKGKEIFKKYGFEVIE
ncbi:molybdate ABC transporter substrate-binding protein [Methanocaldococcus sp.]